MELSRDKIKEIINDDWLLMDDCEGNKNCDVVKEMARIALASLEAEPVAWLLSGGGAKNNVSFDSGNAYADPLREVTPLYTAPPAAVVSGEYGDAYQGAREDLAIWKRRALEAEKEVQRLSDINDYLVKEAQGEARMGEPVIHEPAPVVPDVMDDAGGVCCEVSYADGWNACRAALLQGSQPVSNRDELREQVRREHAEWSQATFGDVGPVGPLKHLSKEAMEAAAEPDDLSEWADMQFLLWDAQRRAGISDGEITAAMEEKLKVNMARQWPEPKDGEPRQHIKEQSESVFPEVECDICGHVSTDPEGRHYCCEDNSND